MVVSILTENSEGSDGSGLLCVAGAAVVTLVGGTVVVEVHHTGEEKTELSKFLVLNEKMLISPETDCCAARPNVKLPEYDIWSNAEDAESMTVQEEEKYQWTVRTATKSSCVIRRLGHHHASAVIPLTTV